MDSLIEKFGMKKIAIVFGVFAVIMVLVLLLLKHGGGEDVLYKCSKSANYLDMFEMKFQISMSKVSDAKKLSFNYIISSDYDYSEDVFRSYKDQLSNNFRDKLDEYFYDYEDDISYNVSTIDNDFIYGFDIMLDSENNEIVNSYFEFDFLNSSTEETIIYLEGRGFLCEK